MHGARCKVTRNTDLAYRTALCSVTSNRSVAALTVRRWLLDVLTVEIQCVPLGTESGISLIILTPMKILQRNLNRTTFVVWEMKRNVSVVRLTVTTWSSGPPAGQPVSCLTRLSADRAFWTTLGSRTRRGFTCRDTLILKIPVFGQVKIRTRYMKNPFIQRRLVFDVGCPGSA